jgi:TLD
VHRLLFRRAATFPIVVPAMSQQEVVSAAVSGLAMASSSLADCRDDIGVEESKKEIALDALDSGCPNKLRLYVETRRSSLTPREYSFLQELCDHGDAALIQRIHAKLQDQMIFPEDDPALVNVVDDGEASLTDLASITSVASDPSIFLSEERQRIIAERRMDCMIGKLWSARQSGLMVSTESSRRSLASRASSISSLTSSSGTNAASLVLGGRGEQRETDDKALDRLRYLAKRSRSVAVGAGMSIANGAKEVKALSPRSNFRRIGKTVLVTGRTIRTLTTNSMSLPPRPTSKSAGHLDRTSQRKLSMVELAGEASTALMQDNFMRDEKKDEFEPHQNQKPPRRPMVIREASANNYSGMGLEVEESKPQEPLSQPKLTPVVFRRPVLMRMASVNVYHGEGIEVADWEDSATPREKEVSHDTECRMESLISSAADGNNHALDEIRCLSFDETMSYERSYRSFMRPSLRRNLSDSNLTESRDREPWDDDDDADAECFDTWRVLDSTEYIGSHHIDFFILGTSADDLNAQPHVLSPPLMESLQQYLPYSKRGESYWLKYSLVRDGASMMTFLQHARGAAYSLLAIETLDGEVFGAFTTEPWRKNWNTYGGKESFLWKAKHPRDIRCRSIIDQAQKESEISVFHYTFANDNIQLCTSNRISIGGGSPDPDYDIPPDLSSTKPHEWGFGTLSESYLTVEAIRQRRVLF